MLVGWYGTWELWGFRGNMFAELVHGTRFGVRSSDTHFLLHQLK